MADWRRVRRSSPAWSVGLDQRTPPARWCRAKAGVIGWPGRAKSAPPKALIGLTLQRARGEVRFQALIENHLLTPSEGRIIEMLLAGAETGRIAQALDISIETLRTHLKHAYQKLGVRSRGELFAEALSFVGP